MPEAIVQQIENAIFLGKLSTNEILPSENALMKQFGVGRNTIREALRILETSGLIKVKQGARGGSVVTQLSNEFVSDFLIKAIVFGGITADHLSQFRLAFEPTMVEMLAKKKDINPELLSRLDNNILQVNQLYDLGKVTAYVNMAFHYLLAMATENPMFIILMKSLETNFNLIITPNFNLKIPLKNKRQLQTIRHHEKILKAVKNGDHVNAKKWMNKHLTQMETLFSDEQMWADRVISKETLIKMKKK